MDELEFFLLNKTCWQRKKKHFKDRSTFWFYVKETCCVFKRNDQIKFCFEEINGLNSQNIYFKLENAWKKIKYAQIIYFNNIINTKQL